MIFFVVARWDTSIRTWRGESEDVIAVFVRFLPVVGGYFLINSR